MLLFLSCVLVKFYCGVITRSRLQLINTSIDTFFSKFCAFLVEQRKRKKVKRKLDGTASRRIISGSRIPTSLYIDCEISGGQHLSEPGLTAGR